jgi:ATP-dependent helicase/nuclease subunit B
VPSRLIVGPPGAGKTHRLIDVARSAAREGRRVAWIALPHQRHAVHRRLVEEGALLGVEVLTGQGLLYRLLAQSGRLRPLVTGTERLALTAEALAELSHQLPTPGEARLFARSLAEAKRHGLTPADLAALAERLGRGTASDAQEARRLVEVAERYERLRGDRHDYDDVRVAALALPRSDTVDVGADVVVVDGFRELGPLDLAIYRSLGRHLELWLSLPVAPEGWEPDERLEGRPNDVRRHAFANPVAEMRWVLRALKRDLAEGLAPHDVAMVAPAGSARGWLALADEFGIPLSDESPTSLAETREGRVLIDLLDLAEGPTASRLLSVPELGDLARAAFARRIAGHAAIEALAAELDLTATYRALVRALTPHDDLPRWCAEVVDRAAAYAGALAAADEGEAPTAPSEVRDLLWARGLEAARLARFGGIVPWWAALVRETSLPRRPRPGVPLLDTVTASGRRFRRVYLTGAVAGAYAAGEREDYFLPEDVRAPYGRAAGSALLPRRHRGGDAALAAELLARADEVVVSAAVADRSGPTRLDTRLLADPVPAPPQPAGSALELTAGTPFRAVDGAVLAPTVSAEALRRSDPCTFRVWAERFAPDRDELAPWGVRLRRALVAEAALDDARLAALAATFPDAAPWLARHREALQALRYGVRVPADPRAPAASLDAAERLGGAGEPAGAEGGALVRIVRFLTADEDPDALLDPARRWNELFAARMLLRRHDVAAVHVVAWPLLGDPRDLTPEGLGARERGRLEAVARLLDERWRRWREGPAQPTPGHHCRTCRVRDVCREAPTR